MTILEVINAFAESKKCFATFTRSWQMISYMELSIQMVDEMDWIQEQNKAFVFKAHFLPKLGSKQMKLQEPSRSLLSERMTA